MRSNHFSIEQQLAINHFTGPALIVAGPGSGKTTVIVNRIKYLIYQKHIKPENILVITFSKAAAISMQTRFFLNVEDNYLPVNFGTFHSIFYNIVKNHYPGAINKIATSQIKKKILLQVLHNISYTDNTETEFIESIEKRISYYKNSDIQNDNVSLCNIPQSVFMDIFEKYCELMRIQGIIDFEDMMLMCKEILLSNGDIRQYYQKLFSYILIDEFQDINNLQFEIVQLLLNKDKNIFAVGDDDQSIYGFRGANPSIMQDFSNHFTDAQIIRLSCNYRSTGNIIEASKTLIAENKIRYSKDIYTENDKGKEVCFNSFENEDDENRWITSQIKNILANERQENVAILYRNNRSSAVLLKMLINNNINCHIYEKPFNPFNTVIFNDFMHYYRMSKDIDNIDTIDFIPVMNKPVRYISRKNIIGKTVDITYLKGMNKDKNYVLLALKKFEYDMNNMKQMDLFSAFHYFRKVIGYETFYCKDNTNFDKSRKADLNESTSIFEQLQGLLKDFSSIEELNVYLETLESKNDSKEQIEVDSNGVYIMTYHASKGLEFDNVFIPKLMEGEIPSSKSVTEQDIEEERRMLYVAMTRAKTNLYMTYLNDNSRQKRLKSRFLYCLLRLK